MSHSSQPHYAHAGHPHGRVQSAASVSRHLHRSQDRTQAGYILAHGGHQVRIGPVAFWIVVGTLVIMGIWSIATGTYFAFSNDVLTRLIGRQAEMQFAYEDRIAELRAHHFGSLVRWPTQGEYHDMHTNSFCREVKVYRDQVDLMG